MAKIKYFEYKTDDGTVWYKQYIYMCQGCGYEHAFGLINDGGHHTFNGDLDNPTVSPSLLKNWDKERICHSFIKEGKIQYLGDCWHKLKGQTIDLPEI